jgi:hypothetical protein
MPRRLPVLLIAFSLLLMAGCGSSGASLVAEGKGSQPISTAAVSGVFGNTLCLNADVATGTDLYAHIERFFGAGAVESPSDGVYQPTRPHVLRMAQDPIIGAHFGIEAIEPTDVNQDLVPLSRGGDRSRTEIKIAPSKPGPHDAFKAIEGDRFVYAWRFLIPREMKFSPSFTHIHQIKAYGGMFSDPPLITFTPLANGRMEVRHVGDAQKNAEQSVTLGSAPLNTLVGRWLDVREDIIFSNTNGRYQLTIADERGEVLLRIDRENLALWRMGADHMRPKWGIYRKHHPSLNQHIPDTIYFANFAITRGAMPASACR